jgi:hypothetical protein
MDVWSITTNVRGQCSKKYWITLVHKMISSVITVMVTVAMVVAWNIMKNILRLFIAMVLNFITTVRLYIVTPRPRRYGDDIFSIHPTVRDLRRQQIREITKKQNGVGLQNSVTRYLTTQLLYNSIMNITIPFKAFKQ